jgi:protein-S-isoprenylcysteine O-methyltransferase Ste14
METKTTKFAKIFGSGPIGVFVSLVLFFAVSWLDKQFDFPKISNNRLPLDIIFFVSILITIGLIVWSTKSLPTSDRGNKLCTTGAFKYIRHPLYAAFLSVFNFGLAVYLNSYFFIFWAILLHPIWHYIIRYEEKMMIDIFKEEYVEYKKRTGRFFP